MTDMFDHTVLAAQCTAPRQARRFVGDVLEEWHAEKWREDAILIVSELATNAVRYDGPTFEVSVGLNDAGLRIAVDDYDSAHAVPDLVDIAASESESGRGL